jgi:hypothetical protein
MVHLSSVGKPPRTEPLGLLDWLDDVPDILWLFALIGILAGFVGIAAWLIA